MMDAPVLIVGAGPVGLASALLLARQGVASTLLERRPARGSAPRAHAINPRTLEICRALGLPREVFAARATPSAESLDVRFMTCLGGKDIGVLPYERQDADAYGFTPTPLLNIAQPEFEAILEDAAAHESLISIRRGVRWEGFHQDAEGVTSRLDDGGEIHSRWLIAADGAESAVRKVLGVAMIGPEKLQHRLMIHFAADLRPLLRDRAAVIYWNLDPAAPGGFIAFDMSTNWVFMYRYDPDLVDPASFSEADCERLVRRAIDGEPGPIRILSRSPWTLSVQLAERYREGRVLLVGDAAHRFPPTGGLGLNTGVQDAHNLAWKIAMVERGIADLALLQSYEAERRPIAEVNAAQSYANARRLTELFTAIDELAGPGGLDAALEEPAARARLAPLIEAQREHFDSFGLQLGFSYGADRDWVNCVADYRPSIAPGARAPHAWVRIDGKLASTLDLLSLDRFTLITADPSWRGFDYGAPAAVKVVGEDFYDSEGGWARLAPLADGVALLVRPDGHVVSECASPAEARAGVVALLNP